MRRGCSNVMNFRKSSKIEVIKPRETTRETTRPQHRGAEILKIGLTGGIASGKSLAREYLKAAGIPTIDADDIVHQMLAHDENLKRNIRQHFGDGVFFADGTVNRKELGHVVFANPEEKKLLESWIHPKTREGIVTFFHNEIEKGELAAVAIIPLFFESSLEPLYDTVWLLHATPDQQLERLMRYRQMSEQEARQRIDSQFSYEEKLKRLKQCPQWEVLDNTGTPEALTVQLQRLINKVKS